MRIPFILLFNILFFYTATAQLVKRDLDIRLFDMDLYPFEIVKYSDKYGFALKPNYDKQNAINYFSRNFNYTLRKDTLLKNPWLAPPVYEKLEKWSYGLSIHFIAGLNGSHTDLYTYKGELLGTDISNLSISISGEEKNNSVITMQTGKKWKWFYQGDFYKNDIPFYYRSPAYDKLELITDSVAGTYSFKTGEPGKQAIYNEVGHLIVAEEGFVLANAEITKKAEEEKKKNEVIMAKKTTAKQEKIKKKGKEKIETPEELSAKEKKRLLQKRIEERDKMISYVFYDDSVFFGLKTASGKVLIYPVMEYITITYPTNANLADPEAKAVIQFKLYDQEYEIRSPDFGGPETIDCFRMGTAIKCQLRWNKGAGVYGFD